ncbi:hypothetical protein [Pseudomonas sp.]|uniref:hypothetical protein n=1 Tax=Pseudomonas sp. TaxID=306 RepID=UPI00258C9982|nr:hypothetical protein [Pseudomonas sp.]
MAFKVKKIVKHTDAKWFEFDAESKVLIASIDNPDYQISFARSRREFQRHDAQFEMGQAGVIEGEKTEYESQCYMLANHVMRDWQGVQDADGNPLPFTSENAEALLLGDAEAFLFVLNSAREYAAELRVELGETVGKPLPASSGKKSSAAKARKSAG